MICIIPFEIYVKLNLLQILEIIDLSNTQCGNFISILSFRFYVKSILGILKLKKSVIFAFSEALIFILGQVSGLQKVQKFIKKSKCEKCACFIVEK